MAVGNVKGTLGLKFTALMLSLLLLSACEHDPLSADNDPKLDSWSLDIEGPSYMQGMIELIVVEDIHGRFFRRPGGSSVGSGNPGLDREYARGWTTIGGNIYSISSIDLPKRIFVRWQSIVEQKTYKGWVDIPESGRSIMRGSTARRCPDWPDYPANPMISAVLGVAPGGVIRVWANDNCLNDNLIAGAQAEIEPLGPDQGLSEGRFAYPITEHSKRYIERYGIPYGSW
ncbi:DUF2931 family protein [Pseudomonas taetrolens]|uniref:DUF2931 family protein n=2 Tax=Pseudomonas taetrolens TaxID=47884 RepID=UPI0037C7CD17